MSEGEPVPYISDESLKRIYEADKLRDAAIENGDSLRALGVEKVLFFGSAMEGTANESSDTDLCVIYHRIPGEYSDFNKRMDELEEAFAYLIPGLDDVSFREPQAGERTDGVQVTFVPDNDEDVEKTGAPFFAQDAITLWSKEIPQEVKVS